MRRRRHRSITTGKANPATAPDPAADVCLRKLVTRVAFPASVGRPTRIACVLRYTVEDPRQFVKDRAGD
jgi:hypothetical protein